MKLYVEVILGSCEEGFDARFETQAETVNGVIRAAKNALMRKYHGLENSVDIVVTLDDIFCKRPARNRYGYTYTGRLYVSSDWKRVSEVPRAGFYPMIGA